MDNRNARKVLLAGAIAGGILSIAISLLMDKMYADSLQGTWRDAIAKDLNTLFSLKLSSGSLFVNAVFVLVLGFLSSIGAFMGFIFSFFLYKFFSFLGSK